MATYQVIVEGKFILVFPDEPLEGFDPVVAARQVVKQSRLDPIEMKVTEAFRQVSKWVELETGEEKAVE